MRTFFLLFAGVSMLPMAAFAASSSQCVGVNCTVATEVAQTTTTVTTQTTIRVVSSAVQSGLRAAFGGPSVNRQRLRQQAGQSEQSGLNSGDAADAGHGLWANGNYTELTVDPDGNSAQRRVSDMTTGLVGYDYNFGRIVAGASLGYSVADTKGRNPNLTALHSDMETITFAPYAAWMVTDNLVLDALLGYSDAEMDQMNENSGRAAFSSTSGTTWFSAINGSYYWDLSGFEMKSFAGFSYQRTKFDRYTDSRNQSTDESLSYDYQIRVGQQVGYSFGMWTPYASLAYERDSAQEGVGESSARGSLGLNAQATDALSISGEYSANFGRDTQTEQGATLNLRLVF